MAKAAKRKTELLLAKAKVAQMANVSMRSIDRVTERGILPCVTLPGLAARARRYRKSDVEAWISGQGAPPKTDAA